MNTLFIDTTTSAIGYGVGTADGFFIEHFKGDRDSIVPDLFDFVEKHIVLTEIDAIAVVRGPGLFTGIRTGCLIANAFKLAQGDRPNVFVIDTLTAQMSYTHSGEAYAAVRVGKHDYCLAKFVDGQMRGEIEVVQEDALIALAAPLFIADEPDNDSINAKVISVEERLNNTRDRFAAGTLEVVEQALPLYVKKPNITLQHR